MSGFPVQPCPGDDPYAYLQGLSRVDLAWEWLRRDADYRQRPPSPRRQTNLGLRIDIAPAACIARWGCLCIEDPDLRATEASMLWTSALDPDVLRVSASPCSCHDAVAFDLRQWADRAVIIGDTDCEHVLLRGPPDIRLDVIAGTLHNGPVSFLFDMTEWDDWGRSIRSLRRCLHACRTGDTSLLSIPRRAPLRRVINTLRVHDALQQGASTRDIGIMLFGRTRVEAEWRSPGEALKSCCRRLIAHSRFMAGGGYRKLLR